MEQELGTHEGSQEQPSDHLENTWRPPSGSIQSVLELAVVSLSRYMKLKGNQN